MASAAKSGRNLAQEVVRSKLTREELEEQVDVIREALSSTMKAEWVLCPHCRRKHEVEVKIDALTRIKALELLQGLGWGRARPDEDERRQGFVLNRTVVESGVV